MTSRDTILARIKSNQPQLRQERLPFTPQVFADPIQKFKEMLRSIGGAVIEISDEAEIRNHVSSILPGNSSGRIVNENYSTQQNTPHSFQNVDLTILRAEFGVAENGALWVTENAMPDRVVPFICSHLAIIVKAASIVSTLHDAYEKIGSASYEFGTFIAGPSKTADIEQSLVLGAHGAKTMTCFLILS